MKKRVLSLALCLVLVVGLFSGLTVNASASKLDDLKKEIAEKLIKEKIEQLKEEFEIPDLDTDAILSSFATAATSGDFGENNCLHWEVSTGVLSGKTLTISGTGVMPDFNFPEGNLAPWWNYEALGMLTSFGNFKLEGELKKVVIKDGVTNVGDYALFCLPAATQVTLPDSVTRIGWGAFSNCAALTGIRVAEGNSHYSSDASGVLFSKDKTTLVQCPGAFAAYAIPNSVTSIGRYAFYYCTSLTSVTIPGSVTSIEGQAFRDCTSLTDVYYAGSEAQWKAISISSAGNNDLLTANIHYNYVSHTHSYKDVVTAPTCTAKGYTTHTCACGDSYVDTYTDALGHAWDNGKVTKEPTETETGVKTFTCTRCGETKTEVIPATGSVDVTEMFTDVSHSWADDGIQYCVTHQLMSGIGNDLFGPKLTTTRAQIVQILYNLEGEPKVSGTTPFTDLTQDWYQDAVLWAYQTGVVAGTSSTTFEPDRPVTREQIAVILMEYMTRVLKLERTWTPADLSIFPDAGSVSDWAKDAMADAVGLGLISGASNGGQTYLEPQGSATREQVATILMEFCKNVKK